ncbi:MAG: malto-oligosyltrehalose synthase [Pseudonocardiales bacterium]|nr:malto-oligosyltrehalose synthase [Actinomycetota bacterium]
MGAPTSTYRLQVRAGFDLYAAADACDYLATLGAGAAYLSPLLPSTRGSAHGYDVVGFDTVDPARGGLDGWTRLLVAARARGLAVVVDIVPNHTGVADATQNAAWWDVLRLGRDSAYASWFDIDWARSRVLLPVLGDDYTPDELELCAAPTPPAGGASTDGELRYYEHRFPIAPGTDARPGESAAAVHDRQNYELVNYRRADTEQNYRRFFAVTALAGLRVEDEAVFTATHEQIARWLRDDAVDGVRVDHPDGLTDPLGYLVRLRALAGDDAWLTVEKILEPGEELPDDWPVDGTTGYDALAEVGGLFVDPSAESALDGLYRDLTGDHADFAEHVAHGKRQAVTTILRAEVSRMARLASNADRSPVVEALNELIIRFPVYRSYLPRGSQHLATAIEAARAARPDLAEAISALTTRLADPTDELCTRFQQATGAVMAKGVEDTAYYRYTRFIALNEVGGDPARFGVSPDDFHNAQHRRQQSASRSMTTLSTHDTKRGEDVRARLAVLSELPAEWAELVGRLMKVAPVPDPTFGYLLWQTFAGAGFIERDRMHAYAEKAMREAAQGTRWIDPDAAFEAAVHAAVDAAYDSPSIRDPLAAFIDRITPYGWSNSLAQKLVQLTMPGVPDVYQGTELWEDSLVDPDNRRAVDFRARRALLDSLDGSPGGYSAAPPAGTPSAERPAIDGSGAAKLWVVSRTLRLRRDWPDLFSRYDPVPVTGGAAEHAVAFDRGGAITLATRLPVRLERDGGWRDTVIELGRGATDVLSGRSHRGATALADLLGDYPVALLVP